MPSSESRPADAAPPLDPAEIAASLGIHLWQLAAMLHAAAAEEFRRLASLVYAGHEIDDDRIDRARRLHAAAVLCDEAALVDDFVRMVNP